MTSNSEARKRHEEPLITGDHKPLSMDYLKLEAERLPGGTAAKMLSALTLAAIDSDIRNSGSDTPPSVTKLDPDASFVTITISRKAAKTVADWPDDERFPFSSEFGKAARAALGER